MALLSIGERFSTGGPPLSLKELEELFNDQKSLAASSVQALQQCGLVMPVAPAEIPILPDIYPADPWSRSA